jgi:hypothetical protein
VSQEQTARVGQSSASAGSRVGYNAIFHTGSRRTSRRMFYALLTSFSRVSVPQALPTPSPDLLEYLPLGQLFRKDDHDVFFALYHYHEVVSDLKSLECFVDENVLDTGRWNEARGGCLQVRRGGGGGLDTETAEEGERFLCRSVRFMLD